MADPDMPIGSACMRVGVPRELKDNEYRVAITPAGVRELVVGGHEVLIEKDAGEARASSTRSSNEPEPRSSRTPTPSSPTADMVLKVKEPSPRSSIVCARGSILFTYLHLAASEPVTQALLESKTTGVAYETVELPDGPFRCWPR